MNLLKIDSYLISFDYSTTYVTNKKAKLNLKKKKKRG